MSGFGFYVLTLPIDRAKTVLMTDPLLPSGWRDSISGASGWRDSTSRALGWRNLISRASGWRAAQGVVAAEGWRGLYRGCSVTLLRTFVGQAVGLTVYSCTLRHLKG